MTVIRSDRRKLDTALDKKEWTLLLVSGDETTDAAKIHDKAEEKVTEPWRKTFRIEKLSVLTASERKRWFGSKERYVVLGGGDKDVAEKDGSDALMLPSGNASVLKIRRAFAVGDLLE